MPSAAELAGGCQNWCNPWTCAQSECLVCGICQPSPPPAPLEGINPFADVDFLVSPEYSARVQRSVRVAGGPSTALGSTLAPAAGIPTAVWLDTIGAVANMRATLQVARRQQRGTGTPTLSVFVVYNLPGRDCGASASAGELEAGEIDRYKNDYIAAIASIATEFDEVPKVFLLEPDSLANLVTNAGSPRCRNAAEGYKEGISHAIRTLGPLGSIYVDAAWSGWIGTWDAPKMAALLVEIMALAGDAAKYLRGFTTNVSNYGSAANEAAYAAAVRAALAPLGHPGLAYIIDTGRSGGGQATGAAGTWCNPRGASIGPPPTANPLDAPYADAYFWIKPP